jgi:hypothetical protein
VTPPRNDESIHFPDYQQLHQTGWTVGSTHGRYCIAWRGADEAVFLWEDGRWQLLGNRSAVRPAA